MTVGEIIHKRRKECHLTLKQLGQYIGVSKQTVQRYESGLISNIPGEKMVAMAEALQTTPAALMGWESMSDEPVSNVTIPRKRNTLPMLGKIACGEPIYAEEQYEGDILVGGNYYNADFCLMAKGDSMIGARIYDGDVVFIRAQTSVDNGKIAAVIIDGEATLKRVYYYPSEQKLILSPENKNYAPLVYVGSELEQIRILGVAVAFQSIVH